MVIANYGISFRLIFLSQKSKIKFTAGSGSHIIKMNPNKNFLTKVFGYSDLKYIFAVRKGGAIAQSVEQWTENPCVPGSIPGGTTPLNRRPL